MKTKLILFTASIFLFVSAHAEKLILSEIEAPSDLENIHIKNIGSDIHSTDFIIFVKRQVPLHKHIEHTETIYVLEGKGLFQLGDETFEVIEGDYIRVPKGTPHSVKVLSSIPLKVLSIQAPEFFGKDRVKVE